MKLPSSSQALSCGAGWCAAPVANPGGSGRFSSVMGIKRAGRHHAPGQGGASDQRFHASTWWVNGLICTVVQLDSGAPVPGAGRFHQQAAQTLRRSASPAHRCRCFLPASFERYMAMSALRSGGWHRRRRRTGKIDTPIEAVTNSSCLPMQRLGQLGQQPAVTSSRCARGITALKQHGEFIATQPRQQVFFAQPGDRRAASGRWQSSPAWWPNESLMIS